MSKTKIKKKPLITERLLLLIKGEFYFTISFTVCEPAFVSILTK